MTIKREWATPLTAGAFLLTAATGVLMFFHLDTGLNKEAHEWLSLVFLAGALMHVTVNFKAFKRYFSDNRGRGLIGLFAVLLALSFIPLEEEGGKPPFVLPVQKLAAAPVTTLAQVAGVPADEMMTRLQRAGITLNSADQTLQSVTGDNLKQQMTILNSVLGAQ
ncbi:DUF4405 domain-containing protein [Thalassolituus sp. LLYu03]|uniref:DUF4405 domain-containing protein n=1 Tax=Thalassolituus sp. LLYu03 TaxID=3421656 RepID=UPI003D26DE24